MVGAVELSGKLPVSTSLRGPCVKLYTPETITSYGSRTNDDTRA